MESTKFGLALILLVEIENCKQWIWKHTKQEEEENGAILCCPQGILAIYKGTNEMGSISAGLHRTKYKNEETVKITNKLCHQQNLTVFNKKERYLGNRPFSHKSIQSIFVSAAYTHGPNMAGKLLSISTGHCGNIMLIMLL